MRVAIVTTSGIDPLYRNWPEYALARGLVARGHEVAIYRYEPADSPPCATIDGIRVHTVRPGPLGSPDLCRQLDRAPRPDVVHLWHIRNLLAYEGARYARRHGVPLVHTPNGPLHDDYLVADRDRPFEGRLRYDRLAFTVPDLLRRLADERRPRHALRNYRIHAPLRAADRLIAISAHEARVLRRYGLPAARIATIPQWIDVAYQDALPQEPAALDLPRPLLLYVGQLKYRKGFDVLAAAMPLVLRDYPTASFVFVGHSPLHRDALEASARASGVADHLHLLGRPDPAELHRLYRAADALLLPTRYEGFGLPPLEAMAAGCPVVTTDVPAVNELVRDGENGLLARYGDPASLAATLGRLLADPALRARLVAAGRETVTARYDGDRLVARIEAVYREARR
ncbi:MAG TPA: glycosyltransferase family 4 protein [Thermomicrobiales bacterium]|nr:glycosyltransferase family 4 protein [Thermomicrobiales bacterium]